MSAKGKSALFWIAVVGGGSCALCGVLTVGVIALGLVTDPTGDPVAPSAVGNVSRGKLPTGETPDLYPGSPGWLPSGRGVAIPPAQVVAGRPQGLWWHPQVQPNGKTAAVKVLFLADGTRASNPRPGGGALFDLEGQRAQKGVTGVGTFEVSGDQLTEVHDGFTRTARFRAGDGDEGRWLEIGEGRYWPLEPVAEEELVGAWTGPGGKYDFRADGTFQSGHVTTTGAWVVAAGGTGTWELDGYLLALRPEGAPARIDVVGVTGNTLVIGSSLYTR